MAEKSWKHCLPIITIWHFFFRAQRHVTQKPAVRFCWKANSVKILWLSSLPASMKIWLKMAEKNEDIVLLFHSRAQVNFFQRSRACNSETLGPILPKFELGRDWLSSLPASMKKILLKWPRKVGDTVFPIISQWDLSVAIETRVLGWPASNLYVGNPPLKQCYTWSFVEIGWLMSEIFLLQSVNDASRSKAIL